jgi:surfactin synthase thioesterase subunit
MRQSNWIEVLSAPPEARLLLVFLPFAGGGAATFRPWVRDLETWRPHTQAGCTIHLFEGGHFYFDESRATFMTCFTRQVAAALAVRE